MIGESACPVAAAALVATSAGRIAAGQVCGAASCTAIFTVNFWYSGLVVLSTVSSFEVF